MKRVSNLSVTQLAEGTSVTQLAEGTSVAKLAEGTSVAKLAEGTSVTQLAEGTSVAKLAERTSVTQLAERTSVTQLAERTSVTQLAELTSVAKLELPDPLLPNIEIDTGSITFTNGVPVGGNAHLSLFPNGAYSFTGHYHDSGITGYNTSLVFALKDNVNDSVFTFSHQGQVHGTFEAGSRDDDWSESGINPALAADWGAISKGHHWASNWGANRDFTSVLDDAVKAVGYTQAIIPVVAPDPLLPNLELDTGYITFNNGVPVGGYGHLSLSPNGAYNFTGHFHDSGALSYNTLLAIVLKDDTSGTAFTFSDKDRVHGTFGSGSRDADWSDSGINPDIAAHFGSISNSYHWQYRAGANLNLADTIDNALQVIGTVAQIVSVVNNDGYTQ